jgi:hypothetical protein
MQQRSRKCSGKFYHIPPHSTTFYCILPHSATFCHILLHSTTFYHILPHSVTFCHILPHSATFNRISPQEDMACDIYDTIQQASSEKATAAFEFRMWTFIVLCLLFGLSRSNPEIMMRLFSVPQGRHCGDMW